MPENGESLHQGLCAERIESAGDRPSHAKTWTKLVLRTISFRDVNINSAAQRE